MTLIVNLNSIDYIYDYLDLGVEYFVVGAPSFSCRQALTLNYEEIAALKNKSKKIKVFVLVNALVEQHLLENLKIHLQSLADIHVDGILFQDFGVLEICKENHYNFEKIYMPDTLNTNDMTLSFLYEQGVDGSFLAREIPLEEKKIINSRVQMKTMVQIHGVEYMAYSKRKLLSNYKEVTNLTFDVDKKEDIQIRANGTEANCHIYEDDYGTHILSCKQICALDVLNHFMDFDYLFIDGQFIDDVLLLEVVNLYTQAVTFIHEKKYAKESIELMHLLYRLSPEIEYYHSFLFDSTVYKIADVRKREENEGNKSNY